MSRLIERGSHLRFFSAPASLVFNTIFAALLWARSSLASGAIFVSYEKGGVFRVLSVVAKSEKFWRATEQSNLADRMDSLWIPLTLTLKQLVNRQLLSCYEVFLLSTRCVCLFRFSGSLFAFLSDMKEFTQSSGAVLYSRLVKLITTGHKCPYKAS